MGMQKQRALEGMDSEACSIAHRQLMTPACSSTSMPRLVSGGSPHVPPICSAATLAPTPSISRMKPFQSDAWNQLQAACSPASTVELGLHTTQRRCSWKIMVLFTLTAASHPPEAGAHSTALNCLQMPAVIDLDSSAPDEPGNLIGLAWHEAPLPTPAAQVQPLPDVQQQTPQKFNPTHLQAPPVII